MLTCDRISKPSCLTTDDILLQFRLIAARSRIAAGRGMSLRDLPTNCCNRAAFEGICELAAMSKPCNVSGFQGNLGSSKSAINNSRCSIGVFCSGRCRLAGEVQYYDVCLFAKAKSDRREVVRKSHERVLHIRLHIPVSASSFFLLLLVSMNGEQLRLRTSGLLLSSYGLHRDLLATYKRTSSLASLVTN